MKKLFVLTLAFAMLLSCSKKNDQVIPDETNYLPLKIGNYWVYEHYRIDAGGNETKLSRIDSIIISKDTLIEGEKYYVLEGTDYTLNNENWAIISIIKPSKGDIVSSDGETLFSETNFEDILAEHTEVLEEDTLYTIHRKMVNPEHQVSVPAGTFDVLNYKGFLTLYLKNAEETTKIQKSLNTYYSIDVGKVLDTYLYHSQQDFYFEKRLVRYNIN